MAAWEYQQSSNNPNSWDYLPTAFSSNPTSSNSWVGALGGGLLGTLASGGSKQTGTNTVTSAPWTEAQPYIKDLMSRAKAMSNVPGISQNMTSAFQGMQGALNNPLAGQAQGVISNTLNTNPSNYFGIGMRSPYDGMNNPYLQKSITDAQNSAYRAMNPMFNAQKRASGAFGNSGLDEAQTRQMAETMGTISNNAYMNEYGQQRALADQNINRDISQFNQGMNTVNNAAFNAPSFNTASMNNYGNLFNTANTMNQAQWAPLQNYGSMVGGNYGSTQQTPIYSNPYSSALGGAMIGSQLFGSIFGD